MRQVNAQRKVVTTNTVTLKYPQVDMQILKSDPKYTKQRIQLLTEECPFMHSVKIKTSSISTSKTNAIMFQITSARGSFNPKPQLRNVNPTRRIL